jgi:hypothetical protein
MGAWAKEQTREPAFAKASAWQARGRGLARGREGAWELGRKNRRGDTETRDLEPGTWNLTKPPLSQILRRR